MKVPKNWGSFGFVQKAAYLCSTRQVRDYSEACEVLARRGRRKAPAVAAVVARMEQMKLF